MPIVTLASCIPMCYLSTLNKPSWTSIKMELIGAQKQHRLGDTCNYYWELTDRINKVDQDTLQSM